MPKPKPTKKVEETPQEPEVPSEEEETPAEEAPKDVPTVETVPSTVPCPDCTVLVADGGKSEFSGKGGVKPGLINPNTHCPTCEGHGTI